MAAGALQARHVNSSVAVLQGPWRQDDGDRICYVHGDQVITYDPQELRVVGIVDYKPSGTLVVRNEGKLETWHASVEKHLLQFGKEPDIRSYHKLGSVPAEASLKPFPLGKNRSLPADQIQQIQKEIERRWELDQSVRHDPVKRALAPKVDAENRDYFLRLIQDVGWLDVGRFGTRTSVVAALFVKHIYSMPLNLAVLPYVEHDLKATGDGEAYAILYDDTQLHLGRKQRYGTQIAEDSQGKPYVLPLEQPERVDEFRKSIGQPPLASYIADASRVLYDGKPIRLARPDE
jgi:hypothetical protein